VLSASLFARFRSRQGNTYAEKLLSAMRQKFGGHTERKQEKGSIGCNSSSVEKDLTS